MDLSRQEKKEEKRQKNYPKHAFMCGNIKNKTKYRLSILSTIVFTIVLSTLNLKQNIRQSINISYFEHVKRSFVLGGANNGSKKNLENGWLHRSNEEYKLKMLVKNNMDLWQGNRILIDNSRDNITASGGITIEVVVAYCKADLNWMTSPEIIDKLAGPNQQNKIKINIMSNCGGEGSFPGIENHALVSEVNVVKLPNTGGCDHAYAVFMNRYLFQNRDYFMNENSERNLTTNIDDRASSLIIFLKDTTWGEIKSNIKQPSTALYRTMDEILAMAKNVDFVCGTKTSCRLSPYHVNDQLYQFHLPHYFRKSERDKNVTIRERRKDFNKRRYQNLKDFHERALNWTFPNKNLTSVCYGGYFAVRASRLLNPLRENRKFMNLLRKISNSLTRQTSHNTTVEEHYMERTWAGLLSQPLSDNEVEILYKLSGNETIKQRTGIMGALKNSNMCDRREGFSKFLRSIPYLA